MCRVGDNSLWRENSNRRSRTDIYTYYHSSTCYAAYNVDDVSPGTAFPASLATVVATSNLGEAKLQAPIRFRVLRCATMVRTRPYADWPDRFYVLGLSGEECIAAEKQ